MENYEEIESIEENKYSKGFIEGKEISAQQSFEYGYKDGIQVSSNFYINFKIY